jgi:hypothetical protein
MTFQDMMMEPVLRQALTSRFILLLAAACIVAMIALTGHVGADMVAGDMVVQGHWFCNEYICVWTGN